MYNSSITAIGISEEYDNVIEKIDVVFGSLKQVVDGQEDSKVKQTFEAIELQHEVEKEKKTQLLLKIGTSTAKPKIGEIYKLNIRLEMHLEQLGYRISEIDSLSSSNMSKTSSASSQKPQETPSREKRRPCLIWKMKENGIEILPIVTFGGRDLTKKMILDPIPNKNTLKPKMMNNMSESLRGYLMLMPIFIFDRSFLSETMPVAMPMRLDRSDLLYINYELSALNKEESEAQNKTIDNIDDSTMNINVNYDDDISSQGTMDSIAATRGYLFDINEFDKHERVEKWLDECNDDMGMTGTGTWTGANELDPSSNTNGPNVDVHLALHLTNLLPIDIECSIDNVEKNYLKPNQLNLITSGNKYSTLVFTIPYYDNIKWISEPIDLKVEGKGDYNERLVILHGSASANSQKILRMVLRVDTFHESYDLLLYSPFWILNRTELQLEFQIENSRTCVQVTEIPFLVCPEKFESEASNKTQGQLRLYGIGQEDNTTLWSENFSLDVIKSTGMAFCRVPNGRTYMVCVYIETSSFGLTKIVTFSPPIVIINKLAIGIEVIETVPDKEQDEWISVNYEQIIPFWPQYVKYGLMRVRYTHNRVATSSPFTIHQKNRTLLRMNDEKHPTILVEISVTDRDGVKVIFNDYNIDDASRLVNRSKDDLISFSQVNDV
ncbi:unnamed protein product [Rotaria socialis]|uniref:Vacuolar protein sorting-associated protein 13 VPS13 adaptor binding domain-containing protein n=2 Tax=Rotaria socialis TaxID=392032 RepID=A0A820SNX7_9BILA|nr:unnamed protein product [Rotaria socialis]